MIYKATLLDIEGTTGPVTFVHNVLFPLSAQKIPEFIRNHRNNQIEDEFRSLRSVVESDGSVFKNESDLTESIITLLLNYIKEDKKDTVLKSIQGKIWKQSFESGEIKAALYSDVAPALRRWKHDNIICGVYSSGSVQAQKLYFKYSDSGDLSSLLDAYFDTVTGPKKEAKTYIRIADSLGFSPHDILFLTDSEAEAEAALASDIQVRLLNREGDLVLQNTDLAGIVIPDFSEFVQ
jgi:enolase-phosphatase E1